MEDFKPNYCCGIEPNYVPGGYPGSISVQCTTCGKTGLSSYDTRGYSLELAVDAWNRGEFYRPFGQY